MRRTLSLLVLALAAPAAAQQARAPFTIAETGQPSRTGSPADSLARYAP